MQLLVSGEPASVSALVVSSREQIPKFVDALASFVDASAVRAACVRIGSGGAIECGLLGEKLSTSPG